MTKEQKKELDKRYNLFIKDCKRGKKWNILKKEILKNDFSDN